MIDAFSIKFSLVEWLSITGLAQCVMILVYMLFRVRKLHQIALPIFYFIVLGVAFLMQFAIRIEMFFEQIQQIAWFMWSLSIPISTLLIMQLSGCIYFPRFRDFGILLLVPIGFFIAVLVRKNSNICIGYGYCPAYYEWLYLLSSICGAISLLSLWAHRGMFDSLWQSKHGRERYWIIMAFIITNVFLVSMHYAWAKQAVEPHQVELLRITFGIGFVYLVSTGLFRIYPNPILAEHEKVRKQRDISDLNAGEKDLAEKIVALMELDKLYHEQNFSRSDLARELDCSEAVLSKVLNTAFDRTFPKFVNEYRVDDAKRMLESPEIAINTVAFEVGFNSLPSFNRVFKEITGQSPSEYRNETLKDVH